MDTSITGGPIRPRPPSRGTGAALLGLMLCVVVGVLLSMVLMLLPLAPAAAQGRLEEATHAAAGAPVAMSLGAGAAAGGRAAGGSDEAADGAVGTRTSVGEGSGSGHGRWRWPVAAPHRLLTPYAEPAGPYGPGHRGIDVVGTGDEVRAVEGGTVRFAGMVAGRPVVSVLHAGGLISTYEPVAPVVTVGQRVETGTVIGSLQAGAASHCAPVTCLHLGAREGESYRDPLPLLGALGPSILLPLSAGTGGSPAAGP